MSSTVRKIIREATFDCLVGDIPSPYLNKTADAITDAVLAALVAAESLEGGGS